jgi:hypothetical protein
MQEMLYVRDPNFKFVPSGTRYTILGGGPGGQGENGPFGSFASPLKNP